MFSAPQMILSVILAKVRKDAGHWKANGQRVLQRFLHDFNSYTGLHVGFTNSFLRDFIGLHVVLNSC